MKKHIDTITAPDGNKWPGRLSRSFFTDHGFKGLAMTNSILSDIRVLLWMILLVLIANIFY